MSTTLDQALELSARLAPAHAWVLFTALEEKVPWAPDPEAPWRKVLLFRHSQEPQLWGLPGGAIANDETAEQAAQRLAEAQTGLSCGAFSDSIDYGDGRIFVAPVDIDPLERECAVNSETFWAHPDFVLGSPSSLRHPAVRAAFERIDDVILTLKENTTMANRSEFIEAQSRASRALQAFGDDAGAAPSVPGEGFLQYRARLAAQFQKYAPKYKNLDLNRIGDANAFAFIEDAIYADAAQEAARPTSASLQPGELRAIHTPDASGRMLTQYVGSDDGACWDQFNPPIRYVRRFSTPGTAR